ncbi:zinc-binding alcohol dehydrogenase family protein [Sinomicrobium weinanense]|uniref:Zinc-binding alcohol dehydrogenase family protein n=1 Tax=Sinomicrobium weinanense TaxID=2842200 RepID=A0A926Q489_9FLAO|nr:zinc-binding alcohol dehydrogenase family protein [Sinomicrobium weinanense]MBC9796615.1 zinc-binding alcohol dehydrogenase family protein [Sinomicrobium weinanense]MBU3123861.1 zinc-binding alcohol dehydrogenase family protein [Sinomicrobium weinanense]
MKYIVCKEPYKLEIKEKDPPLAGADEALLKVHKVGVCGTDLHAYVGNQAFFRYPRILGHELAAEVIHIGDNNKGIKPGDRVVVMPYVSCGHCIACRKGKTNCCTNIRVLGVHTDGGMQQEIAVRNDLLIPVNRLSYKEMAIVEPLAIGAHALRRASPEPGETVVVVGCGPIGLGLIKLAKISGARVIAIDTVESRLQFTKEVIGADFVLHAFRDPEKTVSEITNGDMATVVFDATGNKKALETGINYMAHGGKYVLVGLSKGDLVYNHPEIHARETTLMCSRNATLEDFQFVIDHIREFPTDAFVTHEVPYLDMPTHFDQWTDPRSGTIKAMVSFE